MLQQKEKIMKRIIKLMTVMQRLKMLMDLSKKSYEGKHLSATERITFVNLINTLDIEDLLKRNALKKPSRAPKTQAKRVALWNMIVPAFNEICSTNCDISILKRTLIRIKQAPQWKSLSLLFDLGPRC